MRNPSLQPTENQAFYLEFCCALPFIDFSFLSKLLVAAFPLFLLISCEINYLLDLTLSS